MWYIFVPFFVSGAVTLLLVRYARLHAKFTGDHDTSGAQKFHVGAVPRVGGTAIMAAALAGCVVTIFRESQLSGAFLLLLVASLPAFLGGLVEDVTKRVAPTPRLLLAMVSGLLAFYFLDAKVVRLDIWGVDWLLQFSLVSLLVSMFVAGGSANAINIIDGYNGLAAVVAAIIFAGFAYVSFYLGDRLLVATSVSMIGAICGFLIWNYPRGLIFLGDGGAYFIGFMMGATAVLLLYRHPNVSAWFPLLLCIYPVFETLFSIYRKRFVQGRSPGMPDGVHLHMLIYKRLVRWGIGSTERRYMVQRNALTSPYLWILSSLGVMPAMLFWRHQWVLMVFTVLFAAAYVWLYRSLVTFGMPRWLVLRRRGRLK